MSEQDTKEIALKLFRVVNGPGDGGSESAFDCLNGAIKDGWMRLAKIGAKDKVIDDLESELSASQAREAALREKLEAAEGLLLFCLWHSQGGSSVSGQKIRKHFGIGQYDHLTKEQLSIAKDISNAI